jgi:hypothetical protein
MKKLICLLFLMLVSCSDSMNQYGRDKAELYNKMKSGDLNGYWGLEIVYLDYKPEAFIPIAKYAADSLHYIPAHLDVFESYFDKYYFSLDSIEFIDLSKMKKNDKKEALYYLEKAIKYDDTLARQYEVLLKQK